MVLSGRTVSPKSRGIPPNTMYSSIYQPPCALAVPPEAPSRPWSTFTSESPSTGASTKGIPPRRILRFLHFWRALLASKDVGPSSFHRGAVGAALLVDVRLCFSVAGDRRHGRRRIRLGATTIAVIVVINQIGGVNSLSSLPSCAAVDSIELRSIVSKEQRYTC